MVIKLSKDELRLGQRTITKASPWVSYVVNYNDGMYRFIEKDELLHISTIICSSEYLEDIVPCINNFFGKEVVVIQE